MRLVCAYGVCRSTVRTMLSADEYSNDDDQVDCVFSDTEEDSEEDGEGAGANEGEHGDEGSTGGGDDDDLEAAADGTGV